MQINSNNYIQYSSYQPHFTSCSRDVYDLVGKLVHRNDTSFFRRDMDWNKFTHYLADKSDIYCLASSSGDEVYTVIMKLIQKFGDDAKRFYPIKAYDKDPHIIKMANDGYLPMYDCDEDIINNCTNDKFNEYFEKISEDDIPEYLKKMDIVYDFMAKVKPILRDKVIFSVADATEQCKSINSDKAVVLARNFWPYLKDESQMIKFANDLYKNLGKNSAVVIGDYDALCSNAAKNLHDAGFVANTELFTVFEKLKLPETNTILKYYY